MPDYSRIDRLLHQLALGLPAVGELSFDLEKHLFSPDTGCRDVLYVTGLARAGTTILMRELYASTQFASLTYDDMPFALAPNLWGKLSAFNAKERKLKERAHGDGIQVDFDSPEALEEVFWRINCGEDYIQSNALNPHEVDAEILEELRKYHDLVCRKCGRSRYLAKNNNHILRLRSLVSRAENTRFLVLFRHPAGQARSLFQQHEKFRESDSFTRKYMTWLVHHEFGATHRPFQFHGNIDSDLSPDSLDYWLQRWVEAYGYLLELLRENHANVIPVSYERLCNHSGYWEELCAKIDLPQTAASFRTVSAPSEQGYGGDRLSRAKEIHDALDGLAAW